MKPLDPRLLRHARAARVFLAGAVLFGLVATGLILAQAILLAKALAGAFAGDGVEELTPTLVTLLAVVAGRAVTSYGAEVTALRAAVEVKSQLRGRLVAHALDLGPAWLARRRPGELATLATRGLDALDAYFARYLPQLVLAAMTPVAVLAVVGGADLLSALVIVLTLPLIPIFMILVGLHTKTRTERQWHLLERLGGHFLDVVEGLPTLKVFNRAKAQAEVIKTVTTAHRKATMATLRVAFLSALVLELLATLAVALVAVEVGLRLLNGGLPYETALVVLLLAPEAYLPLRNVGAQFHASMEGVTAAEQVFEVLETPLPAGVEPVAGAETRDKAGAGTGTSARSEAIRLENVTVRYTGRDEPALDGVSLTVRSGERVIVTGPSGAGKSTLLGLLLGFVQPSAGRVSVGENTEETPETANGVETDGTARTAKTARSRRPVAWMPQTPHLFAGTIADNIRLGDPGADDEAVRGAARLAGADAFIAELPGGYDTQVGERGTRLSAGQRQRIALARVFLRDAPVLLLDEPTAHLDRDNARGIRDTIERLMAGRTVILVTHDPDWTIAADRTIEIVGGRLSEQGTAVTL